MEYNHAVQILNYHIFKEEKLNLLKRLATNPERYVGVFRPTKPRAKLIQNIIQSYEIRFGDALETLIRELLREKGYINLDRYLVGADGKALTLDQHFTDGNQYYFIEQKNRDDHDSTKKQGQIKNFESKIKALKKLYADNLIGIMYFVDPNLVKNKVFYIKKIKILQKIYKINLFLFYGQEFFIYFKYPDLWTDLIDWITKWKQNTPDFPEIDFDQFPTESYEEIKTLPPLHWRKILENDSIWKDGIIRVIFSDGTTLKLLFGYFTQQGTPQYKILAKLLLSKIENYY